MSTTQTRIDEATTVSVTTTAFAVVVEAVTAIDAPPEAVWAILADTSHYAGWNPFVTRFEGALEEGEQIGVTLALPGRKPQDMRPRVVAVDPGRHFQWLGRVGVPGVLDGRHSFTVEPLGPDRSRLVQHERLSGALVPMFRKMLTVNAPEAFVALNQALAREVARRG